ncbi:MAG: DUF5317 domain-containing protein [Anaerolineales bacterium]|nr:DUF5317 domain-containing protein [Anaerolineales bacterium]
MILLIAVIAGIGFGLGNARIKKQAFQGPNLRLVWLAVIAFLPQFLAFYLPATRARMPDTLVAICLVASQILLLVFAYCNRTLAGMWILISGLVLNLAVISTNGGFMPISPQTAAYLVPESVVQTIPLGSRFGFGKDVLLLAETTRLEWFADRYLMPGWFPRQVAFSIGDTLIAIGAFWLLARQPTRTKKDA